jgi:predicted MFS family arabinose efflux permease
MTGLVTLVRGANPTVRLLVVNQFGINVGFYLLMPFLAGYLSDRLGLAVWLVGVVLGVRNLGQQGMFLVGGTLADRLGCRPMIIAGCLLRTASFGLLAVATSVPALLVASLATGLAGALFNPAVRAYVAAEAGDRKAEAFALFNVGYQGGILVGPLLGLALTAVDFRLAAATAAAVFGALTIAQWRRLPHRAPANGDRGATGVLADWRTVVANRDFIRFAALMSLSYVLAFQVYLALPLAITGALGSGTAATGAVGGMFAVGGVLAVTSQAPVQRWCARLPDGTPPALGVAVMAASFLPPALAAGRPAAVVVVAVLACAVLLTVGTLIAYPYEMATVVRLAGDRLVATHYGLYQTVAGVAIAAGTALTGRAIDAAGATGRPALPWLGLAAAGAVCAAGLYRLSRRPAAPRGGEPEPAPTGAPSRPGVR